MAENQSSTIALVAELGDQTANHLPRVHAEAHREAHALLERLRRVVRASGYRPSGVAPLLACHLDEGGLGASIYRHALLHAGIIVSKQTEQPYKRCPQCGEQLRN